MSEVKEPEWLEYNILGSILEIEADINAPSGSERSFRWRQRAKTGEPVARWNYAAHVPEAENMARND